jgi:hypothetical protein
MKMPLHFEEDFSLGQVSVMLMPWLATKKQRRQKFLAAKKAWLWSPVLVLWLPATCLLFVRMNEF